MSTRGPILWLDDDPLRTAEFCAALPKARTAVTAAAMTALLEDLDPSRPARVVFLDHDLGGEVFVDPARPDTGMEVVRFVERRPPPVRRFVVHSFHARAAEIMVARLTAAGYAAEGAPFGSPAFLDLVARFARDD